MASNIEIKAWARDLERQKELAAVMADGPEELIAQEDIFFNVPAGRLKLRVFDPFRGELIAYERLDTSGPKRSLYQRSETASPNTLRSVLEAALGVRGIVIKQRTLYLTGQTRIHLDRVEGLGTFVELEFVMTPDDTHETGERVLREIMRELEIHDDDLIADAYIDMLERLGA